MVWERLRRGVLRFAVRDRDLQEAADVELGLVLTRWWKMIMEDRVEDKELFGKAAEKVQGYSGYKQHEEL